jgi:hypothetical protein
MLIENIKSKKVDRKVRRQWLTPVIPATQEEELKRISASIWM